MRHVGVGLLLTLMLASGCQHRPPPSIGEAWMLPNGVIVLQLRSLPPGPVAETQVEIAPADPRYADIRRHIGGLEVGQHKPVPPWP